MKRLLAQIGISFFSALAAAFYLDFTVTVILLCLSAIAAAVFFVIRRCRKRVFPAAIALSVAAACALSLAYGALYTAPVTEKYSGEHEICAEIIDEPYRYYNSYCYPLKVKTVDSEKADFKLLCRYPSQLSAEPFDQLVFTARLSAQDNDYHRAKGYPLSVKTYAPETTVRTNGDKPPYYYMIEVRQRFRLVIEELLPRDDAALARAILIGDKYALSEDIRNQFRFSGASYFVVVSGMHFAFFTLFLTALLSRLIKNRFVYLPVVIVFVILYMALTGFSPSVTRSGIMMIFLTFGRMLRRQVYSLNSLGLAGLLMPLVMSPCAAGDIGLILSFYATFAILKWSAPIYERIRIKRKSGKQEGGFLKWLNYLLSLISSTLAANILVLPISLFVFHAFSSVTFLSSILLYFEIEGILALTFLMCALWMIPPLRIVASLLSLPLYLLCELVLMIVRTLSSLPFSYIKVGDFFLCLWVLLSMALFFCVRLTRGGYRGIRYAALGSALILLSGALVTGLLDTDREKLCVYDASGGMTAVWEENGRRILLCCDTAKSEGCEAIRRLSEDGQNIDAVVCDSERELRRIDALFQSEVAISRYLLYDKEKESGYPDEVSVFDGVSELKVSDNTVITLIPSSDALIRVIRTKERTILCLPDGCDLRDLPAEYRRADIAVISEKVREAALLSCTTLILTGEKPLSKIAASVLSDRYQNAAFTCEGDIGIYPE